MMESCGYVRPSNINERILQIKNIGGEKKKKEISFLEHTYITY